MTALTGDTIYKIPIDFKKLVTIEVVNGEEVEEFVVHEDLICHYSSYFRSAFNGKFEEAHDRRVRVVDAEKEVFDIFVKWLYSQKLPIHDDGMSLHRSCQLYVFADYTGVPRLRKDIVDKYVARVEECERGCFDRTATYVYLNSVANSLLRRLIVDDYCHLVTSYEDLPTIDEDSQPIPAEFFRDLLLRREELRWNGEDQNMQMRPQDYYDNEIQAMLEASENSE